jgi:hypothetical protein
MKHMNCGAYATESCFHRYQCQEVENRDREMKDQKNIEKMN